MVKTQFGKDIKRIRCDNGREFTSNEMYNFYRENGILIETTCPHTPEQNGVVERKHRHLLETARALRFEANLPKGFWGECVLTATYIINRLPSTVIENKTPLELLHNRKHDYDFMKVFGCLAYYRNTNTSGDKFEMRGRPGVFLGYPSGTKGYKIYDEDIFEQESQFIDVVVDFNNQRKETVAMDENIEQGGGSIQTKIQSHEPSSACGHDEINGPPLKQSSGPPPQQEPDHDETSVFQGTNENVENQEATVNDERAKRIRTQPTHFRDFHVNLPPSIDPTRAVASQDSSTVYPLSNYISYDKFSKSHKIFLAAIESNDEPKSFNQAMQDEKWRDAMKKEIRALEENGMWTLENLP
ncbi:uncharacterized protein LOC143538502 [Bidens hawaiensis]|uniref:uncharacterized protein LOC143538502 n=1 Tax=Bidens hawaiensis TaxID=980011 RepID=UPI004048F936